MQIEINATKKAKLMMKRNYVEVIQVGWQKYSKQHTRMQIAMRLALCSKHEYGVVSFCNCQNLQMHEQTEMGIFAQERALEYR